METIKKSDTLQSTEKLETSTQSVEKKAKQESSMTSKLQSNKQTKEDVEIKDQTKQVKNNVAQKKKRKTKLVNGLPSKLRGIEAMGISKEKDYFVENLAILYASGMNITEALDVIKSGLKTKPLIRTIDELTESINMGTPIWKALQATGLLPDHITALIKVGEETGKLPENLNVIVQQQQKERVFRSRIRSAMMYPVLLLGVAVVIGLGIAYFVLPNLINVFTQMDMELPFITRMMILVSDFLQEWGYVALPVGFIISIIFFYFLFQFPKTKHIGQGILLRIPIVKDLIIETEIARFGYILGTLLNAGLPIIKALDSLSQTTGYIAYRKFFNYIKDQTDLGKSLRQSFQSYKRSKKFIYLPVQHMIMAAEQSGKLPDTLLNVGQIYEDKTETTTKNFTVVLEPLMLVIVWGVVMVVALGVIQPIYGLTGGFSKTIETAGPAQPASETDETEDSSTDSEEETEEVHGTASRSDLFRLTILENETGYVEIRDFPSSNANIIGKAEAGEDFEYVDFSRDWYKIKVAINEFGWVNGEYVQDLSQ